MLRVWSPTSQAVDELIREVKSGQKRDGGGSTGETMFEVQGLEAKSFWDEERKVIETLEGSFEEIWTEFVRLWPSAEKTEMKGDVEGSWTSVALMDEGAWVEDVVERCPKTVAAVRRLPLVECGLGYVYFSVLGPGARIKPHRGPTNAKLRAQLCLRASERGGITVGGDFRAYETGRCLVFSDSMCHAVQHCGLKKNPRVVLIVDVWHPTLTNADRRRLASAFRFDRYPALEGLGEFDVARVMAFLGHPHLVAQLARVCRRWRAASLAEGLWRSLCETERYECRDSSVGGEQKTWRETYQSAHVPSFLKLPLGSDLRPPGEMLFKLLLVGDSGVGKSSVLNRFADDVFFPEYHTTIGVDFKVIRLKIKHVICRVQLWDTAGPERFRTVTSAYYRGARGGFIVFSLSDRDSFENVRLWHTQWDRYANPDAPLVLLGCKSDLSPARVTKAEAESLAARLGLTYIECSSLTGAYVQKAVATLLFKVLKLDCSQTPLLPPDSSVGATVAACPRSRRLAACCVS